MTAILKSKYILLISLIIFLVLEVIYFINSSYKLDEFINTTMPSSYQERVIPAFQKSDITESDYLNNPIFNSSRKPLLASQNIDPSTSLSSTIDKWSLVGIVTGHSVNKAILYNKETSQYRVVAGNDIIDGWVVMNILPTRLNLQRDGVSKSLTIELSKKTSVEHDIFNTPILLKADE